MGRKGVERKKTLYLINSSQLLCNRWIGDGRGREGGNGKGRGEETYRNEPSKIEWIRKSKKCQMKSTRSLFGVSDASVASERP